MAPFTPETFADADLNKVLATLSTAEKISLLAGPDWWTTTPLPRVGVPSIKSSDGPNGVRGSSHFLPTPANAIPCATALAATFDTDLLYQVGGLLARECRAKGSSVLLAPTVNIQRSPLNGRAFESFSEDPFLSGNIAASYIRGLQEGGVGATIKHFTANDMEMERLSVDVVVPERALREIYLQPFLIAERLAKPWAVMTSYSRLNGVHCSESKALLNDILRKEWGFDGLVMSDWSGTYSCDTAINAGLDLEMPGPTRWRGALVNHLMHAGKITLDTLNERAFAVLQIVQRACRADVNIVKENGLPERTHDTPEDRALNRKTAAEAIVLLKNDLDVLPFNLAKSGGKKKLAVIGPNAKTRTVSGGGSAFLTSSYVVTPLDGITETLKEKGNGDWEIEYSPGCYGHRYLPMLDGWIKTASGKPGWNAKFFNGSFDSDPVSEYDLLSTRMRINDEKPKGVDEFFYAILEGYVVADSSGEFELGLSLVGRGQVFVNDVLVVDNGMHTKQTPGASFYGLGTIEEVGTYPFVLGATYKITVKYTNVPIPVSSDEAGSVSQPPLMMAALRLGGAPKLDPRAAIEDAVKLAKESDEVVLVIGLNMDWEAEASDREGLELPGLTDELVQRVLEVNPRTVVVNQSGSSVAMPWAAEAPTILQSWFAGNECGNGIADVLFGAVNPSARMPLTFPKRIEDCTAHSNWGAESGKVTYGESIFVGYRGYDLNKSDVLFAFGEGKGYSSFEWSDLKASIGPSPTSAEEITGTVSVTVKNISTVPGRDVVQIYLSDPDSTHRRPEKELKGFVKTKILSPGESETVIIPLDKVSLSFWDDNKHSWVAQQGTFEVLAAKSGRRGAQSLKTTVELDTTLTWVGV
ncbi:glycoside hydrolase family 3 protein [Meredithblackwellia eburnea MCA 4105]